MVVQTNRFGKFIRSKCFAVLFFVGLFFANWFTYREICSAFYDTGHHAPGLWLLFLMLGIPLFYEVVRNTTSTFPGKKWILRLGGLYVSFFLYWFLSLLLFHFLALIIDRIAPYGPWEILGFYLAFLFALVLFLYGLIHSRTVVPVHYTVQAGKEDHIFRIVLLSDVHLGIYNGAKHIGKVVDAVNAAQPDLVVIAGDLFDGPHAQAYFDSKAAAAQLRRIQSRNGVVFAAGNHDPATTDPDFRSFLRACNISMLNDCGMILDPLIVLGRNDALSVCEPDHRRPLSLIASGYPHYRPLIVVDHNPLGIDEAAAYGADLVLCCHTHRGQMFPVTLFTQWAYGTKRFWGQHQFGQTHAIVSAGCGVFQLPIRLGTDNEVVSIDLVY